MKVKHLAILVFIMLFSVMFVIADESLPNDPAVNEDANACLEGGAMEGKCNGDADGDGVVTQWEIDWQWTCGWYLIRIDHANEDDRAVFPASCVSLLKALEIPVPEEVVEAAPVGVCVETVFWEVIWYGVSPQVVDYYADTGCTGDPAIPNYVTFVYATSKAEADVLCQNIGFPKGAADFDGFASQHNLWGCIFF